jgi:hypothetical protein
MLIASFCTCQQVSAGVNGAVTAHGLALPSTMPDEHVLSDDAELMQARQ